METDKKQLTKIYIIEVRTWNHDDIQSDVIAIASSEKVAHRIINDSVKEYKNHGQRYGNGFHWFTTYAMFLNIRGHNNISNDGYVDYWPTGKIMKNYKYPYAYKLKVEK